MPADDMPAAEVDVDVALVRALLSEQFPDLLDLDLTALAFGWDNAIFRLGDDLTVRLPRRATRGRDRRVRGGRVLDRTRVDAGLELYRRVAARRPPSGERARARRRCVGGDRLRRHHRGRSRDGLRTRVDAVSA